MFQSDVTFCIFFDLENNSFTIKYTLDFKLNGEDPSKSSAWGKL